jgi:hypothetical protein
MRHFVCNVKKWLPSVSQGIDIEGEENKWLTWDMAMMRRRGCGCGHGSAMVRRGRKVKGWLAGMKETRLAGLTPSRLGITDTI